MTPTRMSLAVGFTVGGSIEKSQNEKRPQTWLVVLNTCIHAHAHVHVHVGISLRGHTEAT